MTNVTGVVAAANDESRKSWQCLIAQICGLIDQVDLTNWAIGRISISQSDSIVMLLMDIWDVRKKSPSNSETTELLRRLVGLEFPDFDEHGEEAETYAKKIWTERLDAYLNGDMPPVYVCGCVLQIESHFDFPVWLGNIYDACDWVDERDTRSSASEVAVAARAIVEEQKAG